MIKGKIFEKCKKYFEEYLFGFDQNHLKTSFLTGKIDLHNVNIRPDKVNELFSKQGLPIALKAGLISELSIKDFENDINTAYDDQNPLNNIIKMHHKVYEQHKQEKELQRQQRKEDLKKKQDKLKQKAAEKKSKDLKEPPMKVIVNLLGGLKLEIKRVHFRYEDDYFQHHKPFAFGVMIESITMDNSETDWTFENLMSMAFTRSKPSNPKTTNKELNIKNIKVYWNSMSEMFVPTSLWEQTRHLQYQIFEAMDASFLKEIMVDAFGDKQNLSYHYLVSPFTVYTSINLNPSQTAQDPYKYQINALISTINANVHPHLIRDILKFQSFLEMFSYAKDLKKYRPIIKIQSFIEQQAYTPQQKKKRAAVIRDWFQLILWYVRLRKISKGFVPYKLLEIEQKYQEQSLQNALVKAKKANLHNYEFYLGSSDEEDALFDDKSKSKSARGEELDAIAQYEKQQQDIKNTEVLREMINGFKFSLRLEGVKASVFTSKKIVRQHQELPRLQFCMDQLTVTANIQGQNLIAKVLLKEIRLLDHFKRESLRTFSRQVNNASRGGNPYQDQNRMQPRDSSFNRSQIQNPNGGGGTLQKNMSNVVGKLFEKSSSNAYNTPDRSKMRFTEMIYGSNASQERSKMGSRAGVPYDFFGHDLPDPNQAHSKTRETLTISDILNNQGGNSQSRAPSQQNAIRFTNRNNQSMVQQQNNITNIFDNIQNTSPSKASRAVKAQKFQQSPVKQTQERQTIMNNYQLALRSETFVDDTLESVEKRCFLLLCGKTSSIDSALTVDVSANIFDEPGLKKKITLNLQLDQIIVEYCNDILKSLTDLGLHYKLAFNFSDLKSAKGPNKLNKKRGLQSSIQYYTPLYVLKKAMFKRALHATDDQIKVYSKKFYLEKEKAKTKSELMREAKEKQISIIQKIKDVDKKLNDINFDVGIVLKNIYLGITGDKDDPFVSNQTLLEFGIDNQGIYLNKQDFKCKVTVFGISVTTLNSFEMLFVFANNMKKVVTMYSDNLAVLTSINNYKDFVKNINKNLDKQRQLKQQEEENEMFKKGSQPKIVVINDSQQNSGRQQFQQQQQQQESFKNQVTFNQPNREIQFEKNIFQMGGNQQQQEPMSKVSNQRLGNNQIFMMNQNTLPPEKQLLAQRKNPSMMDNNEDDNGNFRGNNRVQVNTNQIQLNNHNNLIPQSNNNNNRPTNNNQFGGSGLGGLNNMNMKNINNINNSSKNNNGNGGIRGQNVQILEDENSDSFESEQISFDQKNGATNGYQKQKQIQQQQQVYQNNQLSQINSNNIQRNETASFNRNETSNFQRNDTFMPPRKK